jgi:hypothetical protein
MPYLSYGQANKITADTFYNSAPFVSTSIILRSDSTFYEKRTSCTHKSIGIGTWEKNCNHYKLILHSYPAIKISTESYYVDENDSLVTFVVKDWKGHPIKDYAIVLADNTIADITILTDKNGRASVKRFLYSGYYTQTDDNNQDYPSNSVDIIRFLSKYSKCISVTLSIPTYIISTESIHGLPSEREYQLLHTELIEVKSKKVFRKK